MKTNRKRGIAALLMMALIMALAAPVTLAVAEETVVGSFSSNWIVVPDVEPDQPSEQQPIEPKPESVLLLEITADSEGTFAAGDTATFTVTATNSGNATLGDLVLTGPFGLGTQQMGTVGPGASASAIFAHPLTAEDALLGMLTATASAYAMAGSDALSAEVSMTISVTNPAPDGDAGTLEEEVHYTVSTENPAGHLNLRAAASADAEILAEVPNGADMVMLGREGAWLQVRYQDLIGYVFAQYTHPIDPVEESEEQLEVEPERSDLSEASVRIWMDAGEQTEYGDIVTAYSAIDNIFGWDYDIQWQHKPVGGSWSDIPGATDTSHSFILSEDNLRASYRVRVDIKIPEGEPVPAV